MADSKIIELAKKIRAHAERGVGGEKVNAEAILAKFMVKHRVSLEDLEKTERVREEFRVKTESKFLLKQIMVMVLGSKAELYGLKRRPSFVVASCTPSERLEIESLFEFYSEAFSNDLEIFKHAFIQKNRLYPRDGKVRMRAEMSSEELKRAEKVCEIADSLDKHQFHKQLEGPEGEATA